MTDSTGASGFHELTHGAHDVVVVFADHAVASPSKHPELGPRDQGGDLHRLRDGGEHVLGAREHQRRTTHLGEPRAAVETPNCLRLSEEALEPGRIRLLGE